MLVFPQLSTGASVQYPIRTRLSQHSIQSAMEDGTILTLGDDAAAYFTWRMSFQDLSDLEASALSNFFVATQGNLQPFLFLDPTANLLAWPEDFSQAAWQHNGITFTTAIADPLGGTRASRASNETASDLPLAQASQIPGFVQVCFSAYLRANAPIAVSLVRSCGSHSQIVQAQLTTTWQRYCLSGNLPGVADPSQFAITVPVGVSLEIFGPQVDAQVTPSQYITNAGRCGVYPKARFDMTRFQLTVTGPNRNACNVLVRSYLSSGV